MRWSVARVLLVAGVAGAVVAGCSSATDNKTPKITLTTSGNTASVGQGASTTISVFVGRTRFDKTVTLAVDGAPPGVTAIVTPANIESGVPSATLLVSASLSANPGTATLTVRGTGEGITEESVTVILTVTVTGNFSLSTLNSSLTVAQGGGGVATILIPRTGGNGANVSLAVSGAPSGLSPTVAPTTTTTTSATLTLSASATTPPGAYILTITGATPGLTDQTTSLSVAVVAPPSTASVSALFCSGDMPAWFAYQNEGFGWQQVTPTANAFTFAATQNVSVAFAYQSGNESEFNMFALTRSELSATTDRDCAGSKTLTGNAAGMAAGQTALIIMGTTATTATVLGGAAFTLSNVNARPLDLVATRGTPQGDYLLPDRMIVRRALDLPTGSTIALDFAASESFAPATTNLTVTGLQAGEVVELQNTFWTKTSTFGRAHAAQLSGATTTLYSVPPSQLLSGDLHELFVDAFQSSSSLVTGRSYAVYFAAAADRTDAMGPSLSVSTVSTVTSAPYARMRGQLPSQPEYNTSARFGFFQQTSGGGARSVVIGASAAFLGSTPTTWDVLIPDFTGTAGFNANWMLVPGQSSSYFAEAFSGRTDLLFGALPNSSDVVRLAYRVAPVTVMLFRGGSITAQRRLPQYFRR